MKKITLVLFSICLVVSLFAQREERRARLESDYYSGLKWSLEEMTSTPAPYTHFGKQVYKATWFEFGHIRRNDYFIIDSFDHYRMHFIELKIATPSKNLEENEYYGEDISCDTCGTDSGVGYFGRAMLLVFALMMGSIVFSILNKN